MRERMKRRKPKAEPQTPPNESSQAPLQPAYFENQDVAPIAQPEEVTDNATPSAEEEAPPTREAGPPETELAAEQISTATGPVRRRRRRGRGGRGKVKEAQPSIQPSAPEVQATPVEADRAAAMPAVAGVAPHTSKGAVILAVGLPGSGKSSWFRRHNISPLSSDLLRALLFDDPKEQRFQDLVFSNLRSMLKARLIARRPLNYVDATNLSPHERHTWVKMARDYGYEVHAVYFDVPVEVCMERNQRRERNVPEDVMRRMASKLRPPTFEEGFTKITVVRVKKKGESRGKSEESANQQTIADQ